MGARAVALGVLAIFLLGADAEDVLDADARRRAAQIDVDVGALDALLAEDLLYVHATGEVQAKEELITWLELEEADYVRIETSEVDVLVDGAVAKLVGWQSMEVRIGEQSFRPRSVFTAVYVQRDGRWQLFAYQSNHGDALVQGELDPGRLLKMGLTLLVPYTVSTLSSVQALRGR
jgi:hypothetical protein